MQVYLISINNLDFICFFFILDTLFDNAYLSLLANTFYYLIFSDENEWRNKILDRIFYTFNLEYSDSTIIQ